MRVLMHLPTPRHAAVRPAPASTGVPRLRRSVRVFAKEAQKVDGPSPSGQETSAGLKAVWYGAEVFGKLVGGKSAAAAPAAPAGAKMTREEIMASLRDDYSTNYFVSGKGDMVAYDEECVFSDPFVAFPGVARFKQNVGNLGGMMRDVKLTSTTGRTRAGVHRMDGRLPQGAVVTKWRFSCVLDLPWRPLLAAAGSTTHVIDADAGRVVKHIEAWDVDPKRVVAQLFKPSAKIPTNQAETFFLAASDGDASGMWFSLTPILFKLSVPVCLLSLVVRLAGGDGLPGDGAAYVLLAATAATEVYKFAKAMYGGETGSGGRF
ncbi:hypothetical protein FOA52_004777 [Chlamydomonas sp. UWO 241]|nr:hypothetical protein FOA52_004777 [Chlamydomonas sp. UWO 241]